MIVIIFFYVFVGVGFFYEYGQFIDGKWMLGDIGKMIDLYNLVMGDVFVCIVVGNGKDVEWVIDVVVCVFLGWVCMQFVVCQEILYEIMCCFKVWQQYYVFMDMLNNGKLISELMYFDMLMVIEQFVIFFGVLW